MNLSYLRGDKKENVDENFRRIASVLGCDVEDFVLSHQTHTTNVQAVTKEDKGRGITKEPGYTDVDGLVTNVPGVVLSTFYADCVPLFFLDPIKRAIGLSHSGWRGTVDRMGQIVVKSMEKHFGSKASELYAAIGPSICQDCYEVSEDVAEAFAKELGLTLPVEERMLDADPSVGQRTENDSIPSIIKKTPGKPGKYQLDLQLANVQILTEAGVLPEHISVTDICTCCNKDMIFSHRGSQGRRGNMGAFLCLKENIFVDGSK
jgi:YfiH family protein